MDVPEDIVDLILQHCTSRKALLNYALVQRSWTHYSRVHLISHLSFSLMDQRMNSRLATLTACITSDPSLMQHISILELHRFEYDISHDDDDDDPVVFSKKFTSLCSFLEQITCVKEIRLIRFDWTYIPSSLFSTLLELLSLPTISVLHLEKFRSPSSEDFADLISTPPSLRHLTLVDLSRFRDSGTFDLPDAGKKEGAMLETLELSTFLDAQLLYGLFRPECTLNMSSLKKLTAINVNLPLSLRELVNIVGKSLEELVTNVTARNSKLEMPCYITLTSMPNLLRLELTEGLPEPALQSLFGSLTDLDSHPLREIVVHASWLDVRLVSESQAYFLQSALGALKRVEYRIVETTALGQLVERYKEDFSLLRERGILYLSPDDVCLEWPRRGYLTCGQSRLLE